MKKKVLFVWRSLALGGAEVSLVRLVNRLKNDYEISILCFDKYVDASFSVPVAVVGSSIKVTGRLTKLIAQLIFVWNLLKYGCKSEVIILGEAPALSFFGMVFRTFLRKRVLAWIHVDILQYTGYNLKLHPWINKIFKYSLNKLDAVICVSDTAKRSMIEYLQTGLLKHVVRIYNLMADMDSSLLNKPKDGSPIIFMGLGRLSQEKGFDILIRAYKLIATQVESRLYIYGEGADWQYLEWLITSLNLEQQVLLMGKTLEPLKVLSGCDIFVSPSYTEALPLVTIEALMCRKAVIVTKTGALEVIDNGKYGEVVDIGNVEMLAEKMLKLAIDKELRQHYENLALAALDKFNNSKIIDEWHSVIDFCPNCG